MRSLRKTEEEKKRSVHSFMSFQTNAGTHRALAIDTERVSGAELNAECTTGTTEQESRSYE